MVQWPRTRQNASPRYPRRKELGQRAVKRIGVCVLFMLCFLIFHDCFFRKIGPLVLPPIDRPEFYSSDAEDNNTIDYSPPSSPIRGKLQSQQLISLQAVAGPPRLREEEDTIHQQ